MKYNYKIRFKGAVNQLFEKSFEYNFDEFDPNYDDNQLLGGPYKSLQQKLYDHKFLSNKDGYLCINGITITNKEQFIRKLHLDLTEYLGNSNEGTYYIEGEYSVDREGYVIRTKLNKYSSSLDRWASKIFG